MKFPVYFSCSGPNQNEKANKKEVTQTLFPEGDSRRVNTWPLFKVNICSKSGFQVTTK